MTDQHTENKTAGQPTKQLTIRIPDTLHRQFKIKTVENAESMGAVIERLIAEYISQGKTSHRRR